VEGKTSSVPALVPVKFAFENGIKFSRGVAQTRGLMMLYPSKTARFLWLHGNAFRHIGSNEIPIGGGRKSCGIVSGLDPLYHRFPFFSPSFVTNLLILAVIYSNYPPTLTNSGANL